MRQIRKSYQGHDDAVGDDDLAFVNQRLDELTRQLARMAQANRAPRAERDHAPDRVADALARLDHRLDQAIREGRAQAPEFDRARRVVPRQATRQPSAAPPQPRPQAQPANHGPASWAAQISARQRVLDGGPAAAAPMADWGPAVAPPPYAPAHAARPAERAAAPDYSEVERQLREINQQIVSLHQPYEAAIQALRNDLAEIGRALTEAAPRRAIEALETEVRSLSERLDRSRQAAGPAAGPAIDLSGIERQLADMRGALQHLNPGESQAAMEDAIRGLYDRIDRIAGAASAPHDANMLRQIEQAVTSLSGAVANVASDSALQQLTTEVHGLAAKVERIPTAPNSDALAKLESRVTALMEGDRAAQPELEGTIHALSERIDRMQLSHGDQVALGALEDRIARLAEKLDTSEARLRQLDAIERGLADVMVYLEQNRNEAARTLRTTPLPDIEPEPMPAAPPVSLPEPATEEFHFDPALKFSEPPMAVSPAPPLSAPATEPLARSTTTDVEPPPQASEPKRAPAGQPFPPRGSQRPIDPNLPPDMPLEPGSGVPRHKPTSAAARIAASEMALGHLRRSPVETGGTAAAVAAARNAARAAYLDGTAKSPKSRERKPRRWFKLPFRKAAEAPAAEPKLPIAPTRQPPAATSEGPGPASRETPARSPMPHDDGSADAPPPRRSRLLTFFKTLLIAASVAIIVVGAVEVAIEFLFPSQPSTIPVPATPKDQSKNSPGAPLALEPGREPAPSQGALPPPPASDPETTNSIGANTSLFDPNPSIKLPTPAVTGSIPRKPEPPKTVAPGATPIHDTLPASLSPALRSAALAEEPPAEYEIGARYAEGRGVPQSWDDAARWFKKAADAGFTPAQFRLASLMEKGEGGPRDVQAAQRLYLAAAEKGHAKAMHNLAVLYAEGIDGKPDYKAAAQWFQRAAMYGLTDSQFNLAILYARGIGVPTNLAESYRWFAMAAASGDPDATRKRDEVAARLDAKTLAAAKQAVKSFVPEHEPEEAVSLKAPAGGWDHAAAAHPAKPRRHASPAAATPAH